MTTTVPVLNTGDSVQITPDERCVYLPEPQDARRFGLFEWQKLGDGTFAPVVRVYDTMVKLPVAQRLTGVHHDTLRRLLLGGFIVGTNPSPQVILVSIDSLMSHLEAARDPEFWTPARVRKYNQAQR